MEPSRIPWHLTGVNYVIEATESLKNKIDANHHIQKSATAISMNDVVNKQLSDRVNGESEHNAESDKSEASSDIPEEIQNSVKRVVIANNSTDVPSIGIGINEDRLRSSLSVISSVSASANALILALKVVQEGFGLKFCAYTYIKAIMGASR